MSESNRTMPAISRMPSLWEATAIPAVPTPPLDGSCQADVIIVGAGYTGLSAALHLGEKGVKACVLETHEPGWGGSGLNGGQVNPTLKYDPDDLVRMFGEERGGRIVKAVSDSADLVFALIDKHKIDCQPVRKGWMQLAYSEKGVALMHKRARQWQKRGIPALELNADEVARRTGSQAYAGGWLDGRAGCLHPWSYTRGLVRAALAAGASVHGGSEVVDLKRQGGKWVATTRQGATVTAERVIIATNGYTGPLWPNLSQTILAANSFMLATKPLSGPAADAVLPGGETAATAQRLLTYMRRDGDGRFLMGGRGSFADPTGTEGFQHLVRATQILFPKLGPVEYEYHWAGRVAITWDFLPHIHQPEPGVTIMVGYNGRGVGFGTAMGKHIADYLTGDAQDFPFPVTKIKPIPFHFMQRLYITAGVTMYSLLDRFGL